MPKPIRVLVADDHKVIRQALGMLLERDPEIDVVAESDDGAGVIERARRSHPDVVVMYLPTMEENGLAVISRMRAEVPHTEVIVMTSALDDAAVLGAIRAGVVGYLLNDTDAEELRRAVKAAAAGKVQLAPEATARLMREVRAADPGVLEARGAETLTRREAEVLRFLAQGRANKEIAAALGIGEKTIKTHVSSILAKLGVQSRMQAALLAPRLGLVAPEDERRRE